MAASDDDRFLDEAVARGLLTREQAEDCRRLRAALGEVEVELTVDEVLARKGYLPRERSAELRRALARQRVGRYEVLERIGEGGSGVVWKARDVVLDRLVALKLLSPEGRDDPAWRERFLREARTAVTLNHAGIVRGLDCGEADGYLYFAMEYVPGETLATRLRREGRLPEKDAVRISLEVVRVLRYVASLGVVHRDLKPENLLLAQDGRVKVCDLGLAKPTREEAERAGAEALVAGTPLYVAPEQIRDGDRVDWRADVYSLGATLYHLLAGRPPFVWEKGRDLLQRHLTEIPPSPREFTLDISPGAAAVVLRMLQKDPADRYARIEDLEADLESVLAGRPPLHTASFAMERKPAVDVTAARSAATKRVVPWAAVAATLVALAMVAVASVLVATTCVSSTLVEPRPPAPPIGPPGAPEDKTSPRAPPAPGPVAVPTDTPAEAAARRALEAARKSAGEHPEDLAAQREAFRFVVERHAGTTSAAVAQGISDSLGREIERRQGERLQQVRESAGRAEGAGRIGAALRAWESLAVEQAGSANSAAIAAEVARLRAAAETRLRELLDATQSAAASEDFETARTRLRAADDLGLPWAAREIASRRRDVDAAESAFVRERAATRPAFDRLWASAVLKAGDEGVESALAVVDAAARAELAKWGAELSDLRLDLLLLARKDDVAAVPSASDLRASFFSRLSQRDLPGAEAVATKIEGTGAAATDLRDGLARVRALLAASADEILVLAAEARAAGRPDDAQRLVDRAFAVVPGHPRARVAAAVLRADRGRADEAVAEIEKVLALPAPPPEAHLRLGQILAERRDAWERAQQEVEAYLTLAPDGDPLRAEARAALESILERRSETRSRELRAQLTAAREKGDAAGVAAAAEALVALGSADWKTLLALGDAYADLDRPHDAFLAYHRVVDARPYEREWPKARAAVAKLEQRFPAAPGARDDLAAARTLLEEGKAVEARAAFDALVRRSPFLEDGLAGAAESWLARKGSGAYAVPDDPQRARRLTTVLRLRNPLHLRGSELHAEALLRTGSAREALELAIACVATDPLRPDPATTAGDAALLLGDAAAALAHYRASLDRRRTPRALFGRSLAWEKLGNRAAARDEAGMLASEFGIPEDMASEARALFERLGLEYEER